MVSRLILFLGIISILSFFSSCYNNGSRTYELVQADSLMDSRPDSAIIILEGISNVYEMDKFNQAEYALLLTKARDKNFVMHTSDSLINVAVDFYKNSKDRERKAEVYFYLGSVYRDMEDTTKAIEAFLKALRAKVKEDRLSALIYNNLSSLYIEQGFYKKALEMAEKAYQLGQNLGSQYDLVCYTRKVGQCFQLMEKEDSSLSYYKIALKMAKENSISELESIVLSDIGELFREKKQLDSAYNYLIEAKQILSSEKNSYSILYSIGCILSQQNKLGSARYYLSQCFDDDNIYMKAASRLAMSTLEEKAGNIMLALKYNQEYLSWKDTINENIRRKEVAMLTNRHTTTSNNEEAYSSPHVQTIILSIFITIIILFLLYFKKRNYKQEKEEVIYESSETLSIETLVAVLSANSRKFQECLTTFRKSNEYKLLVEKRMNEIEFKLQNEERELLKQTILKTFAPIIYDMKICFPKLLKDDLYCCMLYLLDYTIHEIRVIMCVSYETLRGRRHRIKQKMAPSIYEFIFKTQLSKKQHNSTDL